MIKTINFEMFKGHIEIQIGHNIEDWQVQRKLELKHKNSM